MSRKLLNEVHSVTKPELRDDGNWEFVVRYHNGVDDKIVRETHEEIIRSYESYRIRIVYY